MPSKEERWEGGELPSWWHQTNKCISVQKTPRAHRQRGAQEESEGDKTALKVPPNRVPELNSPDVNALLVPFKDRLLAFEAKHRKAGTTASRAGTICETPAAPEPQQSQRGAAEALVRALHVSREAYADALRAQQPEAVDPGNSQALLDVGNVFQEQQRRAKSRASSGGSSFQYSSTDQASKAQSRSRAKHVRRTVGHCMEMYCNLTTLLPAGQHTPTRRRKGKVLMQWFICTWL
jgi:hypothetical protein